MKLLLKGSLRRVFEHTLIDGDISRLDPSEDNTHFHPQIRTAEMHCLGDYEIEILKWTGPIALNGNYDISIRFTKDEIANLARIAFRNDKFSDVINSLSGQPDLRPSGEGEIAQPEPAS